MKENDRQIDNSSLRSQDAGVSAVDASKPLPHTTGEKIFDFADWYGIGWLTNAGISVVAADYVANKKGAYAFDKMAEGAKDTKLFRVGDIKTAEQAQEGAKAYKLLGDMFKQEIAGDGFNHDNKAHAEQFQGKVDEIFTVLKNNQKDIKAGKMPAQLEELAQKSGAEPKALLHGVEEVLSKSKAKSMLTLMSLMSGGFILMAPIKLAEDHKEQVVAKIDNMLGKKDKSLDEQAQIEARHKQIAEEPNQTWGSVFSGRILGLVPIMTFNKLFATKDNVFAKQGFKGTDAGFEHLAEKMTDGLKSVAPETYAKLETKFEQDNAELVGTIKSKVMREQMPNAMVENTVAGAAEKESANLVALENMAEKASQKFKMSGAARMNKIASFGVADVSYSLVAATVTMMISKAIAPLFDKGGRKEDFEAVGAIPPVSEECKSDAAHAPASSAVAATPRPLDAPRKADAAALSSAALASASPLSDAAGGKDATLTPFVMHGHAMEHTHKHHVPEASVHTVQHLGTSLSAASQVQHHDASVHEDGSHAHKHEHLAKTSSFAEHAAKGKHSSSNNELSYS